MSEHNHNHEHEHEHEHCHDSCACGCEHCEKAAKLELGEEHEHEESGPKKAIGIVFTVASLILLVMGFLPFFGENIKLAFFILSTLLSGYELIPEALEELKNRELGENLLMLVAIVSAFAIGEGAEGAAVSLFFRIGESVEDYAVERSKKSIEKLYEITADNASIIDANGNILQIDSDDIKIGDTVFVAPFEKIPVDCEALFDGGSVDTSAITGESVPVEVTAGMKLLSGSINGSTALKLKAVEVYENSAAARIIKTVEQSSANKGNADKFITRFARIYTPVVVSAAVLLAVIPSLVTHDWTTYIHRALIFLVASCPCALVLSVPLGFFAAIGGQSKNGVIVKGGRFIEALANVNAVLFDKTGTLTDSDFEIEEILPAENYSENDVLRYAAHAESYSTHPLGFAVKKAYGDVDESKISDFEEIGSNGVKLKYSGESVVCGSAKFMAANGVDVGNIDGAQIYVAADGKFIGAIRLAGRLREQSKSAVEGLYNSGIEKVVMLTGDNEKAAEAIAAKCGLKEYKAGLLPEQKTEYLELLKSEGYVTAFVGDGINDTPSLAEADVGIAMGSGTAAALESGDVVLMNSNVGNIVKAVRSSRCSMRVIKSNIIIAIAVKIAVIVLGALGLAPMWAAVFADVGVCIICVINSTRLLFNK